MDIIFDCDYIRQSKKKKKCSNNILNLFQGQKKVSRKIYENFSKNENIRIIFYFSKIIFKKCVFFYYLELHIISNLSLDNIF